MIDTIKFGGSCLKDSESIKRVIGLIKSGNNNKAIIVSAFYEITDLLLNLLKKSLKDNRIIEKELDVIKEKHLSILKEFGISELGHDFTKRIFKLRRLFWGIHYTEEITDLLKVSVLSYGERFSAILISKLLNKSGVNSFFVETDKNCIITDNSYFNATALLEQTKDNFQKNILHEIKRGKVAVITGYFGSNVDGKTTTFGRNGSDYTASVVAYSLDSKELILWKDVSGFMSADPRIVKDSKQIKTLSYYEAAELSYFGAKIIHPGTFEPLMKKNIKILIKNILEPEQKAIIIHKNHLKQTSIIKSIAYNNAISVLRVFGTRVGEKPGIIQQIGNSLVTKGINIYSIITSQTCINLILDKDDSENGYNALSNLCGGIIKRIELEKDLSLIGLVGAGMKSTKGIFARVFKTVSNSGINVEMLSGGASDVAYYIIVKKRQLKKAIRSIHREFF